MANFSIFKQKLYFVRPSNKCWVKKSSFLKVSQNIEICIKIWCQKWVLWLISFPKMYTIMYFALMVQKLQHSIYFTTQRLHPLLKILIPAYMYVKERNLAIKIVYTPRCITWNTFIISLLKWVLLSCPIHH